ncbi:MAG TPA: sugar ABC transporter substrate-binding protein [Solirubrobacterales bacterium]|nr:sugar ABC transporter substrate-binding protein [Solirubrobacterales bacterium]
MKPIGDQSRDGRNELWRRGRALLLVLAAVVLACVVVAGCGSDSSSDSSGSESGSGTTASDENSGASGDPVSIAMFLVATANTHQQAALKGAEQVVEEDGNASLRAFNGNFDPATQSNQIEDATASGQYDAFLVNSIDGTQTIPAITKALDEEIVVVCGFSICGPNQDEFAKELPVTAQVASDYFAVGKAEADALVKGCEEKGFDPCNVVLFNGASTLAAGIAITESIKEVVAEHPNINIVAEAEGLFLSDPSYKAMKPIIQAHPDLNAVIAAGDQEISGALQAIEESPLKGKDILLIGDGASEIGAKGVESGVWYASSILRPFNEGKVEAEIAIAAARGEEPAEDLINSAEDPDFPTGYIDASNVDKWEPEWAG